MAPMYQPQGEGNDFEEAIELTEYNLEKASDPICPTDDSSPRRVDRQTWTPGLGQLL